MFCSARFQQKIRNHQPAILGMVRFQNPFFATILAKGGCDCILIDNEHFPFTDRDIQDIIQAVHAEGACCLVRVGQKMLEHIYRVMDMGADGILAPDVDTAEDAQAIVDAVKYPPIGHRGCCPITAGADYGISVASLAYYPKANEQTIVGLMIESNDGHDNLNQILQVRGIDYFSIGPSDFSGSLGKPGQTKTDPIIRALIRETYHSITEAGYEASGLAYTSEQAKSVLEDGRHILNIGSDLQILSREYQSHISEANTEFDRIGAVRSHRSLKARMAAKEPILLPYMRIADPCAIELACLCGVAQMVIDDEHYPFDEKELTEMIRACHAHGASCIVRVHDKTPEGIMHVLDMGADGICAPQVTSYEEVLSIVHSATHANRKNPETYRNLVCTQEVDPVIGIMVETKGAVEDIDKILSIPELDYISVGPSDITASYRMPGQYDNPLIKQIVEYVWGKVANSHVALSCQCYTTDKIIPAYQQGKRIFNIGSDLQYLIWGVNRLMRGMQDILKD